MSVAGWRESIGSLLDSLPTLGYSANECYTGLLAPCFEDTSEIISMVVRDRRTAHPLRADGAGGGARAT